MHQHPNARLTSLGRRRPAERVASGEKVAEVAREMGVSRQTAHKWLARTRAGEPLSDRRSRPRPTPRRTAPGLEALVLARRAELRCNCLVLAAETGVPARTCARIVARAGMPRLPDLDPTTGEPRPRGAVTRVRHERARSGELAHVDVKKVARVPDGGGWRARGAARLDHGRGAGGRLACPHVAVDDMSRVCHGELHDDERKETCLGLASHARDFYRSLGVGVERVMTDNGSGYRSRLLNDWLGAAGIRHVYTRPYSPWQNGKVERMNRTLAQEWQYARPYGSEAERAEALSAFIEYYNHDRPHSACGGHAPTSRLCQQPIGS